MGVIAKNGIIYSGSVTPSQADWTETNSSADSYILHKPTLGTASGVDTTTTLTSEGTNVPTAGTVYAALANKVDTISGKGLSANDFTNAYKNKLDGIASGAEVNVQSDWNQTSTSADDYIKNKPTDLSAFSNTNTQYITKAVSDLTNYYTKSNTYTKDEVNALIQLIPQFSIKVVDSLLIDNPSPTTIYLLLNSSSTSMNLYTEYIYIIPETGDPYYEKLGEQTINLSDYYTSAQVDTLLNGKVNTSAIGTAAAKDVATSGNASTTQVVMGNDTRLANATTTSDGIMSTTDKTKLDGIATGAEVNQNAFSNIVVGSTTVAADSKTDTLTLVAGTNVTLTPDANNDKITISSKDTTYTFDNTPTANSNNPVKSGGIYNAIKNVSDELVTVEQSASGNPIIVNAQGIDAKELSVEIEPIQDLHGYDKPWAGGSGKNKLSMTVSGIKALNTNGIWSGNVYTINGGTFTVLTDSADNVTGIKINGTFSGRPNFFLSKMDFYANTAYILNGAVTNTSNFRIVILSKGSDYGSGYTYTPTEDDLQRDILLYCDDNPTATNLVFKPMIRTSGDASFAPYSNICPISGHTSVTITDYDSESNTASVTIQLGQTVYGGSLNVTTGELTVTDASVTLDGSSDEVWDVSANRFRCKSLPANCKDSSSTVNGVSNLYEAKTADNLFGNRQTANFVGFAISKTELLVVDNVNFATDDLSAYKTYLSSNNLQICYKLATPQTIQLTPTQLQMLEGYNYITADGEMQLVYIPENALGELEVEIENLASDNIKTMTGYSKPSSTSAITTSDTLNSAIGKLEKALDSAGSTMSKTRYTITSSSWSANKDANNYYTYTVTLSPTLDISYAPNITIAGSTNSTLPTNTEKEQFALLKGANHTASNSLTLYVETKPTSNFYIYVEGLNA